MAWWVILIIIIAALLIIGGVVGGIVYYYSAQSSVAQNSVAQKPVEQKPVEQKPVEQKPVDAFVDIAGTTSWQQASDLCVSKGQRLCGYNSYCPEGPLKNPDGGKRIGDLWAPISDKQNEWVSIGDYSESTRLCKKHTDVAGGVPAWGTTNDKVAARKLAKCCNN